MDDDWIPTPEEEKAIADLIELDKQEQRELDEFFQFPKWFPEPSIASYRVLLSNLLGHFRWRWPNDFRPDMLRQWIDKAKEFYADQTNPDAGNIDKSTFPTDFQSLEKPLIYELARVEHGAGLPPLEGLEFLVDEDAARGYRSATAYQRRDDYQDKQDCQEIARNLWDSNRDLTIKQLKASPALAAYANKYKGRDTLQNWLSEIDPRPPQKKRGPKSRKQLPPPHNGN